MISEANQQAIEAAELSFILGMKVPDVPYQVDKWRREHPGAEIPDGHVFIQPWPAGLSSERRDQVIYYRYKAGRARRALRGIDEQVARAAKAVVGLAACPDGTPVTAEFVIGSYHRLFEIEKSFRMAISRWIEARTGWSIRKLIRTARRYRTIQIQAGPGTITAADPLADDLRHALEAINTPADLRTKLSWPKSGNNDDPGRIPEAGVVVRRSLARRFRVVHAGTGGLSRLTASSSSFAATVAPSVRIVRATAVARARVCGVRTGLSAADSDSVVGA
jgi:hypothetical protein